VEINSAGNHKLTLHKQIFQGALAWFTRPFSSIFVPMLLLASPMYRSLGAAVCWFTLNLCYYVIGMPFVFRKVLRSEKRNWYVQATGIPLAIGLFLGGGLRLLGSSMQLPLLVNMIAVYLAIFTAIAALCRKEICWSLPNFSSLKKLFAT